MNYCTLSTMKIVPIYTQGSSNELESLCAQMYEREHRRWQAQVGRSGGMLPQEKSVQLGAFWHISCSLFLVQKASFFNRQRHKTLK